MALYESTSPVVDRMLDGISRFAIDPERLVPLSDNETRGGYAAVVCADLKPGGGDGAQTLPAPTRVAVKKFNVTTDTHAERLKRRAVREMVLWSSLHHENIIEFTGYHLNLGAKRAWLVCPWEEQGSLPNYQKTHGLRSSEQLQLIQDAGEGLHYLHNRKQPIAHGDIKGGNVLIRLEPSQPHPRVRAVLCDFGLTRIAEDEAFSTLETAGEWAGSVRWCSPELFEDSRAVQTPESDVWAYAWLVWEIMTGTIPFYALKFDPAVMSRIIRFQLPELDKEPMLRNTPEILRELMQGCWKPTPKDRLPIQNCLAQVRGLVTPTPPQDEDLPVIPVVPTVSTTIVRRQRVAPRPISRHAATSPMEPLPRRRDGTRENTHRFSLLQSQIQTLVEQDIAEEKTLQALSPQSEAVQGRQEVVPNAGSRTDSQSTPQRTPGLAHQAVEHDPRPAVVQEKTPRVPSPPSLAEVPPGQHEREAAHKAPDQHEPPGAFHAAPPTAPQPDPWAERQDDPRQPLLKGDLRKADCLTRMLNGLVQAARWVSGYVR